MHPKMNSRSLGKFNAFLVVRFGEALRVVQENLDAKNYYAFNPAIDICPPSKNCFAKRPDFQSSTAPTESVKE